MSSVMPMSPYCARETIGGTSVLPRTAVGAGEAVRDGATVGEGLAVGVGTVLAGVTHAPTTDAVIRRAPSLIAAIFNATGNLRRPTSVPLSTTPPLGVRAQRAGEPSFRGSLTVASGGEVRSHHLAGRGMVV